MKFLKNNKKRTKLCYFCSIETLSEHTIDRMPLCDYCFKKIQSLMAEKEEANEKERENRETKRKLAETMAMLANR